jgi:hypothetical protein
LKRIRYLTVRFDADIEAYELPAFRGAIIEKAGREHLLFHNHLGESAYLYGYPVIQYKRVGRNPALVCVDYGVDEVHHFFNQRDWEITLGNRPLKLAIRSLQMQQYTLQVWERSFRYRLFNWLALSQENYEVYRTLPDDLARLAFLERVLTGNILAFAKGVKWNVDRPIALRIDEVLKTKIVPYKGQKLQAFDLHFRSNVFLPDHLGLGKGVSLGFGTVTQPR